MRKQIVIEATHTVVFHYGGRSQPIQPPCGKPFLRLPLCKPTSWTGLLPRFILMVQTTAIWLLLPLRETAATMATNNLHITNLLNKHCAWHIQALNSCSQSCSCYYNRLRGTCSVCQMRVQDNKYIHSISLQNVYWHFSRYMQKRHMC